MKKELVFSLLYFLILIIELIAGSNAEYHHIRYVTKPLLTISLGIFVFPDRKHYPHLLNFILLALFFSFLGDIFLLFDDSYFIAGLLAFFIAHIMYISAFFKTKFFSPKRFAVITTALLIYAIPILYLIIPEAGSLLPYIILYVIILMIMVKTVYLRKGYVNRLSYQLALIGALLFLISDSLLALDKFVTEIPNITILVMSTYGVAQFLIVNGALIEKTNKRNLYNYFINQAT
ncbi:lysoplasmalogenase [Zhouia spongiae]|uniref:Lysoplasmalogenase n=1 Tax=Zhouia spongiae TaxID=2202721 RepID=A0ABY3YM69_9FLAO|nr:lysoplasmalogenase [Zhouia spongiae]UNY98694.1 lysoplasmalogenase [Zhouia spongiae]